MTKPVIVEKRLRHTDGVVVRMHYYWCPGCDAAHGVAINPDKNTRGAGWDFSGTVDRPTYAPSQLTRFEGGPPEARQQFVCHTFIRDGQIQFLDDCTHELRGRTVPLPPVPDWLCNERE